MGVVAIAGHVNPNMNQQIEASMDAMKVIIVLLNMLEGFSFPLGANVMKVKITAINRGTVNITMSIVVAILFFLLVGLVCLLRRRRFLIVL